MVRRVVMLSIVCCVADIHSIQKDEDENIYENYFLYFIMWLHRKQHSFFRGTFKLLFMFLSRNHTADILSGVVALDYGANVPFIQFSIERKNYHLGFNNASCVLWTASNGRVAASSYGNVSKFVPISSLNNIWKLFVSNPQYDYFKIQDPAKMMTGAGSAQEIVVVLTEISQCSGKWWRSIFQ